MRETFFHGDDFLRSLRRQHHHLERRLKGGVWLQGVFVLVHSLYKGKDYVDAYMIGSETHLWARTKITLCCTRTVDRADAGSAPYAPEVLQLQALQHVGVKGQWYSLKAQR